MKKTRNIAFVVELLLLFVLLLVVIVVITQTFMAARGRSLYAKHLTEVVCLAEDAAEVSMSAPDAETAADLLAELPQVTGAVRQDGQIELEMEFVSGTGTDPYRLILVWDESGTDAGRYASAEIRVFYGTDAEPLYTLTTGDYRAGGTDEP